MIWKHTKARFKKWKLIGLFSIGVILCLVMVLRDDLAKNVYNPKIPFQIYAIPKSPNYSNIYSWYLNPSLNYISADSRKVDVFFVHATTFNGGHEWLSPLENSTSSEEVVEVQLPNYAGPFSIVGSVYAPKYRQASLYSQFSLHDDAREARQFPYRDIEDAFDIFLKTRQGKNGFVLVGVEQGGLLIERLLLQRITNNPNLKKQLVVAYLLETAIPKSVFSDNTGLTLCNASQQISCIFSYISMENSRPNRVMNLMHRSVVWKNDTLVQAGNEQTICVNPLTGDTTTRFVEPRFSQGAANATGLEWTTQPAIIPHKVSAHCIGGVLLVSHSNLLFYKVTGDWTMRNKVNPYNLFYGDLQNDMKVRWETYQSINN